MIQNFPSCHLRKLWKTQTRGMDKYVVLNLFSLLSLYFSRKTAQQLSWSKEAAAEAETVASMSCSGHGHAYVDGILIEGKHVCDCNPCYGGTDCSQILTNCSADALSGDPLFLEPFWKSHAASSAVVVTGWYRISYQCEDGFVISNKLERHIRQLQTGIGNAVTDGTMEDTFNLERDQNNFIVQQSSLS